VQGSTSAASLAATPIRNFEPSWAASAAQGTTVALSYPIVREGRISEGIILLLRSQSTSTKKIPTPDERGPPTLTWIEHEGLQVSLQAPDLITSYEASQRWTLLGTTALCCMTGLASDVDYLARVLQKQVDVHRIIYEGSRRMPVLQIVRSLAELLQEAASYQGGRPYGIQSLIIGRSNRRLMLYTLDPSGGYRQWGTATAIGRHAQSIRQQLSKALSEGPPTSGPVALEIALRASLQALRDELVNTGADHYQALLVWEADGHMCVGTIDPQQVRDCQQKCI
jgi:20S proteasome alpha/beta subunit